MARSLGMDDDRFHQMVGDDAYTGLKKSHEPSTQTFTGKTATGPNGQKLRETTTGDWVP